jgi:hypothetical protein
VYIFEARSANGQAINCKLRTLTVEERSRSFFNAIDIYATLAIVGSASNAPGGGAAGGGNVNGDVTATPNADVQTQTTNTDVVNRKPGLNKFTYVPP